MHTPILVALKGDVTTVNATRRRARFDTDSFRMGIDTMASACMSYSQEHFLDLREETGVEVKGIAAGLALQGRGTLQFNIDDDNGKMHTITIPDSGYIPQLPLVLVSPQHWAQNTSDCVSETTGEHGTTLRFRGTTKTVRHADATHTPVFRTTQGTVR